jgi:hypothetical protein
MFSIYNTDALRSGMRLPKGHLKILPGRTLELTSWSREQIRPSRVNMAMKCALITRMGPGRNLFLENRKFPDKLLAARRHLSVATMLQRAGHFVKFVNGAFRLMIRFSPKFTVQTEFYRSIQQL